MEVSTLQLLFMGIIFLTTTSVGLAPVLLGGVLSKKLALHAHVRNRILSCASCFGAGVFIYVCFMGLLPAADTKFHQFLEELGHTDESWEAFAEFPWGFFVVICGFLIIFTIDKLVHAIENWRTASRLSTITTSVSQELLSNTKQMSGKAHLQNSNATITTSTSRSLDIDGKDCFPKALITEKPPPPPVYDSAIPTSVLYSNEKKGSTPVYDDKEERNGSSSECEQEKEYCASLYVHDKELCSDDGGHGVPSSVIFLVALGVHSVFEGMAVGLQTQKEKALEFAVAVLVHEAVMAFSFGLEVSNTHGLSRCTKVVYVIVFTLTIPLGIAAGVGLQNTSSGNREIVSAVLEAFAAGIFIHVIFIEVLAKEFQHRSHKAHAPSKSHCKTEIWLTLAKVSCICLGIATLTLLSVFMHSHH